MFWEEPRVPGLPGAEDVTDGNVDYYDMDRSQLCPPQGWLLPVVMPALQSGPEKEMRGYYGKILLHPV